MVGTIDKMADCKSCIHLLTVYDDELYFKECYVFEKELSKIDQSAKCSFFVNINDVKRGNIKHRGKRSK